MRTKAFQDKSDILIEKTFFWLIPKKVRPNALTYFRLLTVPIVAWLLYSGYFTAALILFIFSASTDFLDGAMARRRNQITDIGKVMDPVADKLLIATVLASIGFEYLIIKIFILFILLEIISVITGSLLSRKFGHPLGANVYGKIKMVLQSIGVVTLLTGILLGSLPVIRLSEGILFVALFFAILAGVEVTRKKHKVIRLQLKSLLATSKK